MTITVQLSDADILYVRSKFRRNVIKSVSGHSLTSSSHCNFYFSTGHIQISTHSFKGSLSLFSYAIALSICKTKPFFDRGRRRPPANPLYIYIFNFNSFIYNCRPPISVHIPRHIQYILMDSLNYFSHHS